MPIQQQPAIISALGTRKKANDEITRILNKETKPTIADRARSLSNDLMAFNTNIPQDMRPQVTSAGQIFNQRRAEMIQPQIDAFNLAQQTIDAGGKDTQAIMDTFGKFADNPEDMAKLFAAAEADPEEVTPQNAASFAARKAQELGLRSVKKMQAENQQMFGQARLEAVNAKAGGKEGVSWMSGATPAVGSEAAQGLPTDANLIQSNKQLLPPPVSGTAQPDTSMFDKTTQAVQVRGVNVDPSVVKAGIETAKSLGSDKEIAKSAQKIVTSTKGQYFNAQTSASEAEPLLARVNMTREAINRIVARSGSTGIIQNALGQLFNNPDFETIESAKAALAMSQRVPGTGAVSNFDAQQLVNQVASGAKSPEYNYMILAFMEAQARNAQEYYKFIDWYTNSFGTTSGSYELWQKFRQENPMIKQNGNSPIPEYLPGFNADWRQYVAGVKAGQPTQGDNEDTSWIDNLSPAEQQRARELMNMRGSK